MVYNSGINAGINMPFLYIFLQREHLKKGNLTYKEIIDVVTISILSSGIKAAVTEEIVFRGMILRLLQNTFGKKCAVFVSSFLFAVYHFDGIDTSDIKKSNYDDYFC